MQTIYNIRRPYITFLVNSLEFFRELTIFLNDLQLFWTTCNILRRLATFSEDLHFLTTCNICFLATFFTSFLDDLYHFQTTYNILGQLTTVLNELQYSSISWNIFGQVGTFLSRCDILGLFAILSDDFERSQTILNTFA